MGDSGTNRQIHPPNRLISGLGLPHKCEVCSTTDHWHWFSGDRGGKHYTDVCDPCWRKLPPAVMSGVALNYEQKLQRSLKPGQMLGPNVGGMRGIYQRNKK